MPTFRVGKPRVRLEISEGVTVAANDSTYIPWSTATYEDPAVWNPANPTRYVIPKRGLWMATLQVWVTGGPTDYDLQVWLEGGNGHYAIALMREGSLAQGMANTTLVDELDAGDVIRAYVDNPTANEPTIMPYGVTNLTIERIGPDRWTG